MGSIDKNYKSSYIFIGMSGVGKTTLGRSFAKKINYNFLDSDHVIEDLKGAPLQDVVESYERKEDFVKFEGEVIRDLKIHQTVLSTGGSACYSIDAIEHLKSLGSEVIYLDITWAILNKRIKSFNQRGIILFEKDYQTEYLCRREKYEALANHVIECGDKSASAILEKIIDTVRN